MHYRTASQLRRSNTSPIAKNTRPKRFGILLALAILSLGLSTAFLGTSHASTTGSPIESGWKGYCLDDYRSELINGNQVDLWNCNGSAAQDWQVSLTQIAHSGNLCLTAKSINQVTLSTCASSANQVWLRDNQSFLNPNLGLCLTAANASQDQALTLNKCPDYDTAKQIWQPHLDYQNYPCDGTEGQKVACYAIKEWVNWTSQPNNHMALLNNYTGGAAYEEWCADFVSYVYKEAGYPFSNGEYNGWDENVAGNIINQGFNANTSPAYVPEAGDVAYFDYPGGHVEIVVSGGKHPTFIYGNTDSIDPTTSNGNMAANTITTKVNFGSLQYYMLPTASS